MNIKEGDILFDKKNETIYKIEYIVYTNDEYSFWYDPENEYDDIETEYDRIQYKEQRTNPLVDYYGTTTYYLSDDDWGDDYNDEVFPKAFKTCHPIDEEQLKQELIKRKLKYDR